MEKMLLLKLLKTVPVCVCVIGLCLLAGCSSSSKNFGHELTKDDLEESQGVPRVISIGRDSTITYQSGMPVEVPIDIQVSDKSNKMFTNITIGVTGTAPAIRGKDYWLSGSTIYKKDWTDPLDIWRDYRHPDLASAILIPDSVTMLDAVIVDTQVLAVDRPIYVVLSADYVERVRSNDRLSIRVDYSSFKQDHDAHLDAVDDPAEKGEYYSRAFDASVSIPVLGKGSVSRAFTLVGADDHRESTLKSQLRISQIAAFPLPDEEVKALFGKRVADRFFVVRMAIRNEDDKPILVNTGMIQATGRAAVYAQSGDYQLYSIPVTMTPQSWEAVYAVLERDEIDDPRTKLLRRMQFVGALATAWGNAASWGIDALTGLGIYTGVFIPEYEKLRPDSFIAYKRNIVNFSMQEYTKIAQKSVSDTRLLFFSKQSVKTLVPDINIAAQNQDPEESVFDFEGADELGRLLPEGLRRGNDTRGESSVMYIEIGNLSIPFDVLQDEAQTENLKDAKRKEELRQDVLLQLVPALRNSIEDARTRFQAEMMRQFEMNYSDEMRMQVSRIGADSAQSYSRGNLLIKDAGSYPSVDSAKALSTELENLVSSIELNRKRLETLSIVAKEATRTPADLDGDWDKYAQWRSDLLEKIEMAPSGEKIADLIQSMRTELSDVYPK